MSITIRASVPDMEIAIHKMINVREDFEEQAKSAARIGRNLLEHKSTASQEAELLTMFIAYNNRTKELMNTGIDTLQLAKNKLLEMDESLKNDANKISEITLRTQSTGNVGGFMAY